MANVLVTGGAGFIGSHLTRALVDRGDTVTVVDSLLTGKRANLADLEGKLTFRQVDIRDSAALKEAFAGVQYVFHQAALPSVPRSVADPVESNAHNIDGTLNVLITARDCGVQRVIYAASSSAYGDIEAPVKVETLPANPLSPYALQKYAGEVYCHLFTELYGLETVALRYFNVFGPYQDPGSQYAAVIPRFVTAMLRGEAPVIYGDGEQSRDFTFVANNVAANLLAAAAPSAAAGQVVNIACGESISLNQLVEAVNTILGTKIKPVYEAARAGDVRHSLADISKAKRLFGYTPTVPFAEALRQTVAWYRDKGGR